MLMVFFPSKKVCYEKEADYPCFVVANDMSKLMLAVAEAGLHTFF